MSKSSSYGGGQGSTDHLELVPYRPGHWWPVQLLLLLWRWAAELVLVVLVLMLTVKVHRVTGWDVNWSLLAVLGFGLWFAGALYVIPRTRAVLPGLFWCLVTRHRLRVFFLQARIFNRNGRLPWILLVRPTPVGERVWLLLVAGLSVEDFTRSTEKITAACSARSVRVERHRRIGSLVRVDVVRRDPLMATESIGSLLIPTGLRGRSTGEAVVAGPLDLPPTVLDLTDPVWGTPDKTSGLNPVPGSGSRRVPTARAQAPTSGSSSGKAALSNQDGARIPSHPPVLTRGGEDVSDYV